MPSYVIVTESAKEPRVVAHLAEHDIPAYSPTTRRKVFGDRGTTARDFALFPRYVFVTTTELTRDFLTIRHAPHVVAFLGQNDRPKPIDEAWLAQVLLLQTFGALDYARDRRPKLRLGQQIRVISGCFRGYMGVVTTFDARRVRFDTKAGPMSARREHVAA